MILYYYNSFDNINTIINFEKQFNLILKGDI